jgi:hypothetical protein
MTSSEADADPGEGLVAVDAVAVVCVTIFDLCVKALVEAVFDPRADADAVAVLRIEPGPRSAIKLEL